MRAIGVDPSRVPARVTDGIGAARSYDAQREAAAAVDACCGGGAAAAAAAGEASGFTGTAGIAAQNASFRAEPPGAPVSAAALPDAAPARGDVDALLLDIEG